MRWEWALWSSSENTGEGVSHIAVMGLETHLQLPVAARMAQAFGSLTPKHLN